MQFEFIQGGQTPAPKTTNLSSPALERLVPMRDLAELFGCSETEIARWAECLSMEPVPLVWRGSELSALTMPDAFKLHLSMRTAAEDSPDAAELQSLQLRKALNLRDLELAQAREELKKMGDRVEMRDNELKTLMEGVEDLERAVTERAGVYEDLAGIQQLYVQSRAAQSALVLKLSQSQQDHQEQAHALSAAQARFEEMHGQVESARAAVREAESATERLETTATESMAKKAAELADAQQRVQAAEAALQDQPDPARIEELSAARRRTAQKLRRMRRVYRTAFAVERNLGRYCNRLEERLQDRS